MNKPTRYAQAGIGVIEVMVAAVIFALGIVAVIQLQGVFFKNSSSAQARSVAASIAEEKLEDLRSFSTYKDPDADVFDFVMIGTNTGGRCDNIDDNTCVTQITSTGGAKTITVGNTAYSRDWTVTDYYYNAAGNLTTPVPVGENVDQKSVVLTVTWTDNDGSDQTLSLDGIINSNSGDNGGIIASNTGGSGESPIVYYTPSTDDRVNPISVGTDSKRETLVPESTTINGYVQSSFTAYTYNSSNVLLREEEFRNVACSCAFDGLSATGTETYATSYPAWSSDKESFEDVTGDQVTGKVKGCVDNNQNGSCDSNPDQYCEICCRDHHDKASITRKYDPYRSSDDFDSSTGDHKHYDGLTPVTSGTYQESCRLKRIDGYWRVFQDWHMVNLDTIPITDLTDSTTKSAYASYVKDIVDEHIDESKIAGETLTSPPTEPAATNHNTSGNYVAMTNGDIAQVSARALYIDYIDATLLSQIQSKKAASQDYLLHMPFYELEAASLADWNSADTSILVTGPIGNPTNIAADEVKAVASNTNAVILNASIRKSNTGLTALNYATDYNATTNADDTENSDSMTVCVDCSAGPITGCTTSWGEYVTDGSSVPAYSSNSVTYPTACSSVLGSQTCSAGTLSDTATYPYQSCSQVAGANDCTTAGLWVIGDSQSAAATSAETASDCSAADTILTCNAGVLTAASGGSPSDYPYEGTCTTVVLTCTTNVAGKKVSSGDSISIASSDASTGTCTSSGKNYSCSITTSQSATITITSNSVDQVLSTICGSQTADF